MKTGSHDIERPAHRPGCGGVPKSGGAPHVKHRSLRRVTQSRRNDLTSCPALRLGDLPVRRFDREVRCRPHRQRRWFPARDPVCECDPVGRFRAEIGMSFEVAQHLRDLGGSRK